MFDTSRKGSRHLGHERVHLPLGKVADVPFHIQNDEVFVKEMNFCSYFYCNDVRSDM